MTTIRTTRPRSGKTTYHRDGTVTVWDCVREEWVRTGNPSDALCATLSGAERERVLGHCRPDAVLCVRCGSDVTEALTRHLDEGGPAQCPRCSDDLPMPAEWLAANGYEAQ